MIFIEKLSSKSPLSYFEQIARIHQSEIDGGFLSTLGTRFLVKLYKYLAFSPYSVLLVALSDSEILGFICGSKDTSKVYKNFLLSSGISSLAVLFPKLLSLSNIKRMVETLLYPKRKQNLDLPRSEILNFCVIKSVQRQGIGKKLFDSLIQEFQKFNIKQIKIVTGASQGKAQKFYTSLNARRITEINIHQNTKSNIYIFDLPK